MKRNVTISHTRATAVLQKWVATHVADHLNHHENDRQHTLHFNLADMKDILVKFRDDHPRYGKVLIEKAEREGKI